MSFFRLAVLAWCVSPIHLIASVSIEEAAALLKAKDPGATAAIEALVKTQPKSADVRILQTRMLLQQGNADEAIDAAKLATRYGPDNAQAYYQLGNSYGARIGQVNMFSQATMAPRLKGAYERAVELDPDLHEARLGLVEFYLSAPAIAGGSEEKAREQSNELLNRDPPRGHYALGRIALHEERPAEAVREFTAASAARPENENFRMMAGLAMQQATEWNQAFSWFEAWTQQAPEAAVAWYQLGRTSALSGQKPDQGIAALQHYLTLSATPGQPQPQHAWYRMGQIQASSGDKNAARQSFQNALKADPDYGDAEAALKDL